MTFKQSVLKLLYPLIMLKGRLFGTSKSILVNAGNTQPLHSFYQLQATLNNGEAITMERFRNKKVLLVNTASNCGYTAQYSELEELQEQFKDKLVVVAFPSNDFKEQEKDNDEAIAAFCKMQYGITFPLMRKSVVTRQPEQNEVFGWLSNAALNGWNDREPSWNFSKYLVSEAGVLTHYFAPDVSPLSREVTDNL